jgi:hypothetical protein
MKHFALFVARGMYFNVHKEYFGIFCGNLVIFPPFGILYEEKYDNPDQFYCIRSRLKAKVHYLLQNKQHSYS